MVKVEGLIIGVSGKPRAGKTTICDFLVESYGFNHIEMSRPIVADVREWMNEKGVDDLDRYKKEDYRLILQGWGNFARVALGEDYWIRRVLSTIVSPAVIGGVRYVLEIDSIHERGGKVLRVVRNEALNSDTAVTETQLDSYTNFDVVITNNGTLEELYRKIKDFMGSIKS